VRKDKYKNNQAKPNSNNGNPLFFVKHDLRAKMLNSMAKNRYSTFFIFIGNLGFTIRKTKTNFNPSGINRGYLPGIHESHEVGKDRFTET
jgi:hypothetical protein